MFSPPMVNVLPHLCLVSGVVKVSHVLQPSLLTDNGGAFSSINYPFLQAHLVCLIFME